MTQKRAIRLILFAVLFVPTLLAVAFAGFERSAARREQALHKFMFPDAAAVREEFEYFTGRRLPEAARVILARRSRPSPLLGDYSGCALISLDAAKLRALLRTLTSSEDPSRWSINCPDAQAFRRAGTDTGLTNRKFIRKQPDEFIILATVDAGTFLAYWVVH